MKYRRVCRSYGAGSLALAANRNRKVVREVRRFGPETATSERFPQETLVRAAIPICVGLYPDIASIDEGWVAGLKWESINEQPECYNVSGGAIGIVLVVGESTRTQRISRMNQ